MKRPPMLLSKRPEASGDYIGSAVSGCRYFFFFAGAFLAAFFAGALLAAFLVAFFIV